MRGEKVPPERKDVITMYFSGGLYFFPSKVAICSI